MVGFSTAAYIDRAAVNKAYSIDIKSGQIDIGKACVGLEDEKIAGVTQVVDGEVEGDKSVAFWLF